MAKRRRRNPSKKTWVFSIGAAVVGLGLFGWYRSYQTRKNALDLSDPNAPRQARAPSALSRLLFPGQS